MINDDRLSDLLHDGGVSRPDKLLLCLSTLGGGPHSLAELKEVAAAHGLHVLNLSRDLSTLKGQAFRNGTGWALTAAGRRRAQEIAGSGSPVAAPASALRDLLPRLDAGVRDFLLEAISCHESQHYRAAVVLAWVGAVSMLYGFVVRSRLADFNAEATRRDSKWRVAKTEDDLGRMKEHDFLQVLEALSIIGKNVKVELESCLKLRNGCGHPNSLQIAGHRSASHIEVLALNVFKVFA